MAGRPELQKKIVSLVEKELKHTDPRVKLLVTKLLHEVYLDRNKPTSSAANKLQAEIEKVADHWTGDAT